MVVAHGGLLHFLTEDWEDGSMYTGMHASLPRNQITLIDTRNRLGKHGIPYLQIYGGRR